MKVQLYVYDLSQGLARAMSVSLLGRYIEAVYHTSIAFDGVEYFFGAGVQTARAGSTHHGRPMQVLELGHTDLPVEVILEYLESLKTVYTPESYDLFAHNCNNFSNDFAQFLVGRGIPDHITSLPAQVLETPFGRMLKPQIDQAMRPIVQHQPASPPASVVPAAPAASSKVESPSQDTRAFLRQPTEAITFSKIAPLDKLLEKLKDSSAGSGFEVESAVDFIRRSRAGPVQEAALPDLPAFTRFLHGVKLIPIDAQFVAIDLARMMLVDPRASSYFVQEATSLDSILEYVNTLQDCPYKLRLTTLQLMCNTFTSTIPLAESTVLHCLTLITDSLLDAEHLTLRSSAASLALNVMTREFEMRRQGSRPSNYTPLSHLQHIELAASLLECLGGEAKVSDVAYTIALCLGRQMYSATESVAGELRDLFDAMGAQSLLSDTMSSLKDSERASAIDGIKSLLLAP